MLRGNYEIQDISNYYGTLEIAVEIVKQYVQNQKTSQRK